MSESDNTTGLPEGSKVAFLKIDTDRNPLFDAIVVKATAQIVSAYIGRPGVHLAADELAGYVRAVSDAFYAPVCGPEEGDGETGEGAEAPAVEKPTPEEIAASIRPDALLSFLDGAPRKTLRRHLGLYGLTPEGYRARFGLPDDYPMVCAEYAAQRSDLAKSIGLGRPGGMRPSEDAPVAEPTPGDTIAA